MPSLVAYNPNGIVENALQFGTIVMSVNGSVNLGFLSWCPGFGICNQYIIITDTYTKGRTSQGNAGPMGFCTEDLTDSSLISSINKLAASKSSGPFITLQDAITWAISEGFFIINQDYPSIVTNGCVLNLDAGLPASYPLVLSNWYDLSGNGNIGTLNGATYSSSFYGNLSFVSSNSNYVSFASTSNIPSGNTNYTISVWFSASSIGDKGLVGWGNYGSTNEVNAFRLSSTGLINYWWANDLSVNVSINTNTWYNAVATFDGTTREIWLNGSLIGSDTPINHNVTTTSNLTIGRTNNTEYFDGSIGEVQIFNRSLTFNEIIQNYNALLPRYNGSYVDPCNAPPNCTPFISVWRTTSPNESITLPYSVAGTYDGTIDWGDGNITSNTYANRSHTYTTPGDYTVTILGTVNEWSFRAYGGDNTKIRSVLRWGSLNMGNAGGNFENCTSLRLDSVVDVLDLTGIYSGSSMFNNCTSLTTINRVNEWNTSGLTHTDYMFNAARSLVQPSFSGWNVSNVTRMDYMFSQTPFNGYISNWDVSKVTSLENTFYSATSFNQNINSWNVSSVTNLSQTFFRALSFNQPLSSWDVSNVTNMSGTFAITPFNQNINNWDVSKVTTLYFTFWSATTFNQPLSGWNVSNVTDMSQTFREAYEFNQNINNWDTSKNTTLAITFYNAYKFNQPLSGWNVSNVTNMSQTFRTEPPVATSFNQPIGNWNTSAVTTTLAMFYSSQVFNQPLSGWNTSNITNMSFMFRSPCPFNQNIGNWDVSKVTNMRGTFNNQFNNGGSPSISGWNVSNVTNMSEMFYSNGDFNQPIGNWNTSAVTNMSAMFFQPAPPFFPQGSFNQSLSGWNTSNVTNMSSMFERHIGFNQNIGIWNVTGVTNFSRFMFGKTSAQYSSSNLNAIYNGWSSQNVKPSLSINFGTINFTSAGAAGKAILTGSPYNWVIVDGGQV